MEWKLSANAAFFGLRQDRFNQYQPKRSLEEKIALITQVNGIEGIELKYPTDFYDIKRLKELLEKYELALSAVNVDLKDVNHFRFGALSAINEAARKHAIRLLCEGMDIAKEMGTELVTTCPVMDGYDYPFQIDYTIAWRNIIETVQTAVSYRSDVTLLLEYQPHDPNAKILLSNVGKVLYVCSEIGAPNLGVNLDVGHSFAAGESPAEAAALLASKGVLKYIHSSDNTGEGGDWDMVSGTVHFWHWIEFLYTLKRIDYKGWIGGDISPKHTDPVGVYQANVIMIQRMCKLLDSMGMDQITNLLNKEGNIVEMVEYLSSRFA